MVQMLTGARARRDQRTLLTFSDVERLFVSEARSRDKLGDFEGGEIVRWHKPVHEPLEIEMPFGEQCEFDGVHLKRELVHV